MDVNRSVSGMIPSSHQGTKQMHKNPTSGDKTNPNLSTKRPGSDTSPLRTAKRIRHDAVSSDPVHVGLLASSKPSTSMDTTFPNLTGPSSNSQEDNTKDKEDTAKSTIASAFQTLEVSCYDVLPIKPVCSYRVNEVPGLIEEEEQIVSYFHGKESLAENFMAAIVKKIKVERKHIKHNLLQSVCRVYVGLCQQRRDAHKVFTLAYRLLKYFPEAPKLILLMVGLWPGIWDYGTCLCQAIHIVTRLKATGVIFDYLSMYLHWEKTPQADIHRTISSILRNLIKDRSMTFTDNKWYGDDLCPAAWEYVFSLELLCTQLGWTWTYDNIIRNDIFTIMNNWLQQPRHQQTPIRDICVATALRLLGRLGQMGLDENHAGSVQTIAKSMNLFARHGPSRGMPWEVQLSVVYTTHDLAPSNPKEAVMALKSWQSRTKQPVPPVISRLINQISSLSVIRQNFK